MDEKYAYEVPLHIPDLHLGDEVRVPGGLHGYRVAQVTRIGTEFDGVVLPIMRVYQRKTPVSENS